MELLVVYLGEKTPDFTRSLSYSVVAPLCKVRTAPGAAHFGLAEVGKWNLAAIMVCVRPGTFCLAHVWTAESQLIPCHDLC